jgi:hypothetical protein
MVDIRPNATAEGISSLSANQQKALAALLTTTSIGAAAEQCGLHPGTIKRYLADATFAAIYREQRMLILQETVAGISSLGTKAVQAFEDTLDDGDINERQRAAARVMDLIYKGVELERRIRAEEELEQRIIELEEALAHVVARDEGNGYRTYGR